VLTARATVGPRYGHRVLLHATAGMRLLARRRAQRIYTSLYDAVAARNTFRPRRDDFGTLSGSDEGIFGWLCANYLLVRAPRPLHCPRLIAAHAPTARPTRNL
jgi:hypothetical protein